MKLIYNLIFIVIAAFCTLVKAQNTTLTIYQLPKDSTLFLNIDNVLIKETNAIEKIKLNYYGILVSNGLNKTIEKDTYLLKLIQLLLNEHETVLAKKYFLELSKNNLTQEQQKQKINIELNLLKLELPKDSVIHHLTNLYFTAKDTAIKNIYRSELNQYLKDEKITQPSNEFIQFCLENNYQLIVSKWVEPANVDSAYSLIKPLLDSVTLSKKITENRIDLLLWAAHLQAKKRDFKNTLLSLNSINIQDANALNKANYYKEYVQLLLAQKQYASIASVSARWLESAYVISDVENKIAHLEELKSFFIKIGNKKTALALKDSLKALYNKNQPSVVTSTNSVSNKTDQIVQALLQANECYYHKEEVVQKNNLDFVFIGLITIVIILTISVIILLIKKQKKQLLPVIPTPEPSQPVIIEKTIIKEVPQKIESPISIITNLPIANEITNILEEIKEDVEKPFKKIFKKSILHTSLAEVNSCFFWCYDLRLSKTAKNRGVVLIAAQALNNNETKLKLHLQLNKIINEQGITQPTLIIAELQKYFSYLSNTKNTFSILICFLNQAFNELTFCGDSLTLKVFRNNKLHTLASEKENIMHSSLALTDQLLNIETGDLILIADTLSVNEPNWVEAINATLKEEKNTVSMQTNNSQLLVIFAI